MASDPPNEPGQDGDVDIPNPQAGVLFKAEMFAMNVLLGYAKVLIGILVVVLIAALIIGQYQTWYQQNQRGTSADVANVERELRQVLLAELDEPTQKAAEQFTSGGIDLLPAIPELSEEAKTAVKRAAQELEVVGAAGRGTGAADAYIRAAELYRRIDDNAGRRKALEAATEHAEDVILFVAIANLAALDVDEDRVESAVSRLSAAMETLPPFPAQQAALTLAEIYEHEGRVGDAKGVYDTFETRWPDAPELAEVQARRGQLQSGEG